MSEDTVVLTMRQRDMRAAYLALVGLGQRTLPKITCDLKVAKLIRVLKPFMEDFDAVRQKKVEEYTAADNATGLRVLRDQIAFEAAERDLLLSEVSFPDPVTRLTQEDLPKSLKSGETGGRFADGEQNRAGLGAIMVDLGPFFSWPDITE